MSKYDDATKAKALMLAETLTIREASEQTGVPEGTIKRWRFENRTELGEPNRTNRTPKNLKPIIGKAVEKAIEEAGDYITERLKKLADELYGLAEDGVKETRTFLKKPGTKDRDSAAWLRSVVGAMHYGIQDAQLVSGKPTARQALEGQVTERHEYDISYRVEQYTDVYRQLADRMGCSEIRSGNAGNDSGEPVDTARPSTDT